MYFFYSNGISEKQGINETPCSKLTSYLRGILNQFIRIKMRGIKPTKSPGFRPGSILLNDFAYKILVSLI